MTKDDPGKPTPRPGDALTAQDGAAMQSIIISQIRTISEPLAIISKGILEIKDQLSRIEVGLDDSRFSRMEVELWEAEQEAKVARENLKRLEERAEIKAAAKDSKPLDTQERMNQAAAVAHANMEKTKKEKQEAKIEELRWSVIKAVVTWGAVGIVGLIVSVLWFLVQQYINRGSP